MSLVLALVGVAFATFVILPLLFEYFLTYSADTVSIAFRLEDTINLMLVMMAWLAVIFQIPLLMMLGVLIGVTSRRWMASRRIYFWGGFGGVAFLFSAFDPTGVAPILLTLTMIVLFEVTLLLLRWVGR
jgi:sec-independent protein translocase protein TatC